MWRGAHPPTRLTPRGCLPLPPDVLSRHLKERAGAEAFWLCGPMLADELEGGEAAQRLQTAVEIVLAKSAMRSAANVNQIARAPSVAVHKGVAGGAGG